jgi:hypothetical protein
LTPNDIQFWDRIMPVIGPLDDRARTLAFAHVVDSLGGKDIDDAGMDRLLDELRQRFEAPCH